MKTRFKVTLSMLVIAMSLFVVGCNSASKKTKAQTEEHASKVQYTCTMHPEVVQDKPGDCPKCGMALVEKKEAGHMEHSHEGHDD